MPTEFDTIDASPLTIDEELQLTKLFETVQNSDSSDEEELNAYISANFSERVITAWTETMLSLITAPAQEDLIDA